MECCPETTGNRRSLAQLMQKPSFMPVTRHSTHSCVGCDCSAVAYASATNGIKIGAAITIGDTAGEVPQCSTLSHGSDSTIRPGVGPPWYTQLSIVLAQYLSMGNNACWTGHLAYGTVHNKMCNLNKTTDSTRHRERTKAQKRGELYAQSRHGNHASSP